MRRSQIMRSDLLDSFVAEHKAEWHRLKNEQSADLRRAAAEITDLDRRIENLVDALADGAPSASIRAKLTGLEAQRETLLAARDGGVAEMPDLPEDLGALYQSEIELLANAIEDPCCPDLLDIARKLIEVVIIAAPENVGDPRVWNSLETWRNSSSSPPRLL